MPLSNKGRVIPPAGISEQGGGVWGEAIAIAAVIANQGGGGGLSLLDTTMGIQGQVSLLFKSKEIGFDDIIYLMEHLHSDDDGCRSHHVRGQRSLSMPHSLVASS